MHSDGASKRSPSDRGLSSPLYACIVMVLASGAEALWPKASFGNDVWVGRSPGRMGGAIAWVRCRLLRVPRAGFFDHHVTRGPILQLNPYDGTVREFVSRLREPEMSPIPVPHSGELPRLEYALLVW